MVVADYVWLPVNSILTTTTLPNLDMGRPALPFIFTLVNIMLALPFVDCASQKSNLAWNGHVDPGSTSPILFKPYYVPPGAKAYSSSSPLVTYKGQWSYSFSREFAHNPLHFTTDRNASVSFSFVGTGIEWFGNSGRTRGFAQVYIDNKPIKLVNNWIDNDALLTQQRLFWVYDLANGKHTLTIVNMGAGPHSSEPAVMDVDAFVITRGQHRATFQLSTTSSTYKRLNTSQVMLSAMQLSSTAQWDLVQKGSTGVSAMQLAIVSPTHAIIIDKVEHNPLDITGHPAWAALYNLDTHAIIPLRMQSNSFCAGGSFLGNGTLINVGGNPVVAGHTSSADFGDLDGLQAVRLFHPCDADAEKCVVHEYHDTVRMAAPRWYNTVIRITDGSAMIIGGSKKGGWINNATTNNPTIEYYPPKGIHNSNGLPIHMKFLVDTLNANLFPIAFLLSDGKVFIAANRDAMIYNWIKNTERRLPSFPNGVRVTYPMAGTGLLLSLSPENNYESEILVCGGSPTDDQKASFDISSQDPATTQCARMVLTESGISNGWEVEHMPQARTMADAVLLPDGKVLIVNGASSGISGYGNVMDGVGESNADNPAYTPVLYDPRAPSGQRFSKDGMPTSNIPRLYHSVATLTPSGNVMIAGSNPNLDRSEIEYGTEYRVEWLSPPYMSKPRPKIENYKTKIGYGEDFQMTFSCPTTIDRVVVVLMDFGFITHGVHANTRRVVLEHTLQGNTLTVKGPPNGSIYPPGPAYLHVLVDDIPSEGVKVMIGSGESPAVDLEAWKNVLKSTRVN
ncbi:hypothetical protein APHAL10511_000973 [Amanita phalloides]|nr:hypothetical protein APHAL10511_000973 [Amanita phalloides]